MKIADLYARKPERVTTNPQLLRGCYYDHVREMGGTDLALPESAPRVTIRVYKEFEFDCRRYWRLAAVYLDDRPVMIIQNAGREGDDHAERFVTDDGVFHELITYLRSVATPVFEDRPRPVLVDPNEDRNDIDNFYGNSLTGYFERY